MKGKYVSVLLLLLLIFIAGCSEKGGKINAVNNMDEKSGKHSGWNMNGFIIDEKENEIKLVVWNVDQEDIKSLTIDEILKLPNINAM